MRKFYIGENKYLEQKVLAFYNCDYVGYQKQGNPDFINHLKNMTNQYNELDLVKDFIQVSERFMSDMGSIFCKEDFKNFTVCVMPRSKRESKYKQSQLMFKTAISSCANKLALLVAQMQSRGLKTLKQFIIGGLKTIQVIIHIKV